MADNSGITKTIPAVFSPATALLSRMGYTKKFTLLWLMSLAAIAVVMYGLFASLNRVIQPSKLELQGLALIKPIPKTVQFLQLHRGLSAALLGGSETLRDRRAAKESEIAGALQAMEKVLPPRLASGRNFQNIKAGWEHLRKDGLHWTADENFAAHTHMIEQVQSFESSIADDYALILDTEIDTYYLIDTSVNKLPHALEHLGQLRAYGTGILARKQITEQQKAKLSALSAELDSTLKELRINIEKTGRYNPAVREPLLAAYDGIAASARQVAGIVASDILAGHFAMPPGAFLDTATTEIDKGYAQLLEVVLPTTGMLIEARIARAENTLLVSVGSALLMLLLVVYLSASIYYAIISSIKTLVHSAHTFAEGDLSVRVNLNTRDELSHIGDSFNRMAEGFNALLEDRTRAEESLRESESRFRQMTNSLPQLVWTCQSDGTCDFLSQQWVAYTGIPEASQLGYGWLEQLHPDDRAPTVAAWQAAANSGADFHVEFRIRRHDGEYRWFDTQALQLRDAEGRTVKWFGSNTDITERKQAGDALRKSKDLLQSVIENAPVQIFWKDRDSRYLGCNTNFAKGAGYSAPDEVAGKTDFEMGWKDYAESYRADDKAVMESVTPKLDFEEPFTTPDGSLAWAHTSKVPLRDESNQVVGILGIYEDVTIRKQAEQELMKSRQRAQLYLDTAGVMLIALDAQGRVQMINRKGCEMLGRSEADILGKNWFDNYLPDPEREKIRRIFTQIIGGNLASVEYHENEILTASGDVLTVAWHNSPLLDESGKINGALSSGEDITARKQAELALMESQERLIAVIETALDAIVQMNDEGIITGWNTQAEKIFGWPHAEAVGREMSAMIIPPQYRKAHAQGLKRFLSTGEGSILNSRVEFSALHRDGHEFPVELAITSVKMADKYEFSAFIRDITDRKKTEDLIWKQANFDALTGLPNRHMFYDRLAQEIKKAERAGLTMALLYIDLDRFKEVNDTLGHSMGDKLLVETTRRISACVREADTVGRLGGDEFVIILMELSEINRIDALTQNILHELAEPFRLENEVIYLSASIGITLYPHDATGMEELVKNADQAMYAAKNAGRNRFSYFTQSMQQAAQAKLRLANDLRGALAASQFRIYYQPIVDLAAGRIHKAEALIRWQHPVRGMVSPAEFIPLAEETGLIVEIGDWVFREAAHQVKLWRELHGPEFQISVNMSPVQFLSGSSPCQEWPAYLQKLGLPGQSLVIEITEGLLLNEETGVKDKLLQFHKAGIQISLDDFGTGYSSLSYLQKFDIDYLKIDQSFTRGLEPGSSNMALSEAIIVMAHSLGMKVIAEGVETAAQRTLLAAAGCDYGQGYLFSRPVSDGEFEKLLNGAL